MGHPTVRRILLASASPRRRRLFAWLGIPFETAAVDTAEDLSDPLASDPAALAVKLAEEKALAAREADLGADALVLTFDTLVVLDGDVLGKPADTDDAWRMLRSLSGREHRVVTGVAMSCPGAGVSRSFAVSTAVRMKVLSDDDIRAWMTTGEFMDCAGAYNIEGQVAEVTLDECYQNVAGLPLCHLYRELAGRAAPCLVTGLSEPVGQCDRALSRHCRLGPKLVARRAR